MEAQQLHDIVSKISKEELVDMLMICLSHGYIPVDTAKVKNTPAFDNTLSFNEKEVLMRLDDFFFCEPPKKTEEEEKLLFDKFFGMSK